MSHLHFDLYLSGAPAAPSPGGLSFGGESFSGSDIKANKEQRRLSKKEHSDSDDTNASLDK